MPTLACYRCGQEACQPRGDIYVRRYVDTRWQTVPICQSCWDNEEPDRTPVRVVVHDHEEEAPDA